MQFEHGSKKLISGLGATVQANFRNSKTMAALRRNLNAGRGSSVEQRQGCPENVFQCFADEGKHMSVHRSQNRLSRFYDCAIYLCSGTKSFCLRHLFCILLWCSAQCPKLPNVVFTNDWAIHVAVLYEIIAPSTGLVKC